MVAFRALILAGADETLDFFVEPGLGIDSGGTRFSRGVAAGPVAAPGGSESTDPGEGSGARSHSAHDTLRCFFLPWNRLEVNSITPGSP